MGYEQNIFLNTMLDAFQYVLQVYPNKKIVVKNGFGFYVDVQNIFLAVVRFNSHFFIIMGECIGDMT